MRSTFGCCLLVFALFGLVSPTFADVIQINDAHWGVNAVVRDTTNDLDFLRLDFTTPSIYNDVVAQLAPGGTFEGWRVATLADMMLLGDSAGIVNGSTDAGVIARTEQLRDWFCAGCVQTSTTHVFVRGLIADTYNVGGVQVQLAFHIERWTLPDPDQAGFRVGGYWFPDAIQSNDGVYLTRAAAVPEPASLFLVAAGLGLFALRRKR